MTEEFFNVKKAAAYCGYNDKYFGKLSAKFKIPRHGPKKNRFKRSDLDLFMRETQSFLRVHRDSKIGFRKVAI